MSSSTLKKARVQMLIIPIKQNKTMRVSIVSKESQSGLSSNDRLFVWVEGQTFGYISKFQQSDDPVNIDLSKCKVIVPIKNLIIDPIQTSTQLQIKFYILQQKKKVNKNWVFKMQTQQLAKKWFKFIKQDKQNLSSRRLMMVEEKSSKSPLAKDPSKQTTEQKPTLSNKNLLKSSQIPKDFGKQKSAAQVQNKQYHNQLYQSQSKFILSPKSKLNQKPQLELQKKDQNIKRTIDYQDNSDRSKLVEQIRRQEQAKLIKQKKQLQRKQKELQEKQRKIQQNQRKLQQQLRKIKEQQVKKGQNKPSTPNAKIKNQKQPLVLNETFFHQDKVDKQKKSIINSPINKQPALTSPINRQTKNNQKFQGTNYSQIVNNVIVRKNTQSQLKQQSKQKQRQRLKAEQENKKLQQQHNYLLQLQKLKIQRQIKKLKIQNKQRQKELQKQKYFQNEKQQKKKESKLPLQLGWTFRYLVKQEQGKQYQIIKQFDQFCTKILKEVVQQYYLPERQRKYIPKYQREQYFLYQKDDVEFKIAFIGLKEIYNKDQVDVRDNICDQQSFKQLQQQYKNYHTLYKACRQLPTINIKIPLTCLCQYSSFIAFFKVRSQIDHQIAAQSDKNIQINLQNISNKTKINITKLKNKQNILILKLNYNFYKEIAAQIGTSCDNFDHYIVQQIKNIMHYDHIFAKHPIKKSITSSQQQKTQQPYYIRQQSLSNIDKLSQQIPQTILFQLKKQLNYNKQLKTKSKQPLKIQQQKLSQNILVNISKIANQFNNLDFYFIHPKQLAQKLHSQGINMRYLGIIYQYCTLPIIRNYIMSEMAARAAKVLFRKTIQDQHTMHSYQQYLKLQIIDLLNCILGTTIQTQTIWKFISIHSLYYFNTPIITQQIQKGYFLISLVRHCHISINWNKIAINQVFTNNQVFNQDNLLDVQMCHKYYDPILTIHEKQLLLKIQQEDSTAYKVLQQKYQLQKKALPEQFRHAKYYDVIRKYCAGFIPPDIGIHRGYKLLNLYNNNNPNIPTTRLQYCIKFMQLKWYLKRQHKQKYILYFTQLNTEIITRYGDYHPLLSQLYDIMCKYHSNNGQYQDAITFAKSSMINMLKLCGSAHCRLGQYYYQMGLCCIKGNKKQQAMINLQKAKSIYEYNQQQNRILYAFVCLKLGLLLLSQNRIGESQQIVKFTLGLFNRHTAAMMQQNNRNNNNIFEDQKVQCYQILARCYQLQQLTQIANQLSIQCQKQIRYITKPNNLQKILKIVLYPILRSSNKQYVKIYLNIISQLPLEISVNSYMKGFQRISQRIQDNSIVDTLVKYMDNIDSIDQFMKENDSLGVWTRLDEVYQRQTVNDFLSLTVELIYFLGEGYVCGSLKDSF